MLISVCIPTYNGEKYLRQALESCVHQKDYYDLYEILIVNNASTDATEEIILEYIDKYIYVRTIKNEKTVTQYENHNICLNNAFGDYVLFCHTDDTLEPNALSIINKKLEDRFQPVKYILWGKSQFNDYFFMLKRNGWNLNEIIQGENAYKLFIGNGLAPSGTCYSRKSFVEMGGFVDCHLIPPHSDSITMLYISMHRFSFEMIDRQLVVREFASTKHRNINDDDRLYLNSLLYGLINEIELLKVLNESIKVKEYAYAEFISIKTSISKIHIISELIKSMGIEELKQKRIIRIFSYCVRSGLKM